MPPPGGQQQGSDSSMGYLWIMIGIFVGLWAVWYFAHVYIVSGYLTFKAWELDFIDLFSNKSVVIRHWIAATPAQDVNFRELMAVANAVGEYFKWPVAILMVVLACVIYYINPARRYKKTYSSDRLIQEESSNWPCINPIASKHLEKKDLLKGPWAMSLNPMEFAKKNDLLREELVPLKEGQMEHEQQLTVKVIEPKANKIFAMQLGRVWTNVDALDIHIKALFGMCAARANRDREAADKILLQLAESSANGRLNFTGVEALCKKHIDSKLVKRVISKHAYQLTVMASMLELGRTDGVFASAEFLWLKPIDRRMWFMLNTVGRHTPFTEVAGAYAHWISEKEAKRKILIPIVEEATVALKLAVSEILYKPEEEE
jgi:intracellular multiplication protein IcmP